jgi:hypothetical protein
MVKKALIEALAGTDDPVKPAGPPVPVLEMFM